MKDNGPCRHFGVNKLLKGITDEKTKQFERILVSEIPYGISAYTYQEVLQGARNENEYEQLNDYLSTQMIYFLPEELDTYQKAARLYYDLRRKGVTPRSAIDILIALTATENNLMILHNDHDFDAMINNIEQLENYEI
jgi:predicted nucleic acid-binding protein